MNIAEIGHPGGTKEATLDRSPSGHPRACSPLPTPQTKNLRLVTQPRVTLTGLAGTPKRHLCERKVPRSASLVLSTLSAHTILPPDAPSMSDPEPCLWISRIARTLSTYGKSCADALVTPQIPLPLRSARTSLSPPPPVSSVENRSTRPDRQKARPHALGAAPLHPHSPKTGCRIPSEGVHEDVPPPHIDPSGTLLTECPLRELRKTPEPSSLRDPDPLTPRDRRRDQSGSTMARREIDDIVVSDSRLRCT